MDGLLIVDKPAGPTSHDVVARMRRVLGERRIGHTGTLDPAASGVLALVVGRATRLAQFLSGSDKEYEATLRLGLATTTYDAQGDPAGERHAGGWPSRDEIERALDGFRGRFEQRPPAFSAKKLNGVRSYKLARAAAAAPGRSPLQRGEPVAPGAPAAPLAPAAALAPAAPVAPVAPVAPAAPAAPVVPVVPVVPVAPVAPLAPVAVTVYALDLVAAEDDRVTLRVVCSAGFYVRSLAHDLGQRLGTGAHLEALRRLRSGDYGLDAAIALDAAERDPAAARAAVLPLERMLTGWPSAVLTDEGLARVAHGRDLEPDDASPWPQQARVRLLDRGGRLVGIAEPAAGGVLHPAVVFV